jgi:hypothetical protein
MLPQYFHENDSYKDNTGRGLLQRYLKTMGDELDQKLLPEIECYLRILDAQNCEPKYLNHLSDILGNPPDIFGDEDMYRNLLSYICSVYKIKGTKKAYELFFSLLGFNVELIEIPPLTQESKYDLSGGKYDTGNTDSTYDQDRCKPCSYYDLTLYPKNQEQLVFNQDLISRIMAAIEFNEPINAKLRHLTFGLLATDTILTEVSDDIETIVKAGNSYDIGQLYDDLNIYDNENQINNPYTHKLAKAELTETSPNIFRVNFKFITDSINDLVIDDCHFTLKANDINGNLIGQSTGIYVSIQYIDGAIVGNIINTNIGIINENNQNLYFRLNGHLVMPDGKEASFTTNLYFNQEVPINLYFLQY